MIITFHPGEELLPPRSKEKWMTAIPHDIPIFLSENDDLLQSGETARKGLDNRTTDVVYLLYDKPKNEMIYSQLPRIASFIIMGLLCGKKLKRDKNRI